MMGQSPSRTMLRLLAASCLILLVCCAWVFIPAPAAGQSMGDGGAGAASPDSEHGESEEGTFVTIDASAGSETGPEGDVEPVIKPNANVTVELNPDGSTHSIETDSGGNFNLDTRNISKEGVSDVKASFSIPICTWQYKYADTGRPGRHTDREKIRECVVNHVNQFTMRWRKSSNDGKVSGKAAPSSSIILDTGSKSSSSLATPAGSEAGQFQVGPQQGNYSDGSGTVTSKIINAICYKTYTNSAGNTVTEPVTPIEDCGEGRLATDEVLDTRPEYTITMDVETKNTKDEDTGLDDHHAADLAEETSDTYVDGIKNMAEQFTSTMFQQVAIVGSFFDAWGQQDAQRTLRRMQVEAMQDYRPSKAMCRFGSLSSSQAGTAMKMQANQLALNDYMQGRELSQQGRNAGVFAFKAGQSRLRQFKQLHCFDQQNSRNGLAALCGNIAPTGRDYADSPDKRYNRDIDYTRLLATNNTLNFDMTDSELTADEEDIMALSRRLYAQDTFSKLDGNAIGGPRQNYYPYMRVRSINAARSVARNSFTDYVARKARGSGKAAGAHMRALVEELGLSGGAADKYIGTNPSYHAQMDVLNKKMYQDPAFVANLYDTPTNVTRQHVFMYARKLIQRREIYKSLKRREMMLASLLEMRLRDVQNEVNTRLPVVGKSLEVPEEDES